MERGSEIMRHIIILLPIIIKDILVIQLGAPHEFGGGWPPERTDTVIV